MDHKLEPSFNFPYFTSFALGVLFVVPIYFIQLCTFVPFSVAAKSQIIDRTTLEVGHCTRGFVYRVLLCY